MRSARIPDASQITQDTPLRLATAAAIAYPGGEMSEADLKRAIREGRLTHEVTGGHTFVTLAYLEDMLPGAKVPTPGEGKGIVYVLGFGRYVKIGFTWRNLDRRIAALSTGCPEPLTVYAAIEAERRLEYVLHERFRPLRLQGEWFARQGDLARWIKAGCAIEEGKGADA